MPTPLASKSSAVAEAEPAWKPSCGSAVRDVWLFLSTFIRRPNSFGAVAPSSRGLAEVMLPPSGLGSASVVVELGAGTGAITRLIQEQAPPGATVVSFELDRAAASRLQARFRRVKVVCDSAENLRHHLRRLGHTRVDCIISSLPWRSMRRQVRRRILDDAQAVLKPGGSFSTMAYVHASAYPTARRFKEELGGRFGQVTSSRIVWANLPPAFVYYASSGLPS